jgi:hypothetical protein
MSQAAAALVGNHDFRNFARLDPGNITSTERELLSFSFHRVSNSSLDHSTDAHVADEAVASRDQLWFMSISGKAFLWHQVRNMAAILFLVGRGLESESIISQLLDTKAFPRKPIYQMASEAPLLLHHCGFVPDIQWQSVAETRLQTHHQWHAAFRSQHLQASFFQVFAKTAFQLQAPTMIAPSLVSPHFQLDKTRGTDKHQPLLQRPTEKTLGANISSLRMDNSVFILFF